MLLCLLMSIFCVLLNIAYDCLLIDLISFASYALMMVIVFLYAPELIIKYLSFVITSSWTVVALFVLENRQGIVVGNMFSEHSGSLPPYVFGWIVFYCSLKIYENNTKKCTNISLNAEIKTVTPYLIYAALGLAILCFVLVVRHPSFLLGVNRFGYRDSVQSEISRNLYKYAIPLTPIMILNRKKYKKECICFILALIAYNLWIGEKYGGFFHILSLSVLGLIPNRQPLKLKKYFKRIIVFAGMILASLLIIVYFQRMVVNPNEDYFAYLSERIASQGLTWWATYKEDKDQGWHLEEIGDELEVMIHEPEGKWIDYNHGIYKQMKLFQNPSKVRSMLNARVRAAESTRATFFYYLKYLGIIICQIGGAYIAFRLSNSILLTISRGKLLLSYFYALLFRFFYQAFTQSDFYLMTTKTAILCVAAIIFIKHVKLKGKPTSSYNKNTGTPFHIYDIGENKR